ncbi:hypothetical protein BD410DRAFT_761000 [Rickenella mellea]|uniref:DUF6535 domain-containing protein n=1 Tax=Rickenella mellea TaxID=50990 RepID=A0A4Y7QK81_9AGAM|nr:hypothetical protein BD410DRAFT_761000 [Rickenella mellea]
MFSRGGKENMDKIDNPNASAVPDLTEPSARIWGPYLELAEKYDKDLVDSWRDDMESLLIFAALFSASVTAFVIESYQALQEDIGQTSVSILLQISQQLANGTTNSPAAIRPDFRQDSGDITVNVLWFLSLAFSLACALAAVMVRQWARRYLRVPRGLPTVPERARMRQYLFQNLEWWKMDLVVETIPVLLHISLILFMIGLLLFVHLVNFQVALCLLCFSTVGGLGYMFLTVVPILFPGCPYKTPFSSLFPLLTRLISVILITGLASLALFWWSAFSLITLMSPSTKVPKCIWAHKTLSPIEHTLSSTVQKIYLHSCSA